MAAGFVDAQGNSLHVQTVRTAEVRLGDAVFRENFIISPVTSPLICLGHLYRAGYYVVPDKGSGLILTDGVTKIPMGYRNQSFVVKGSIRAVSKESSGKTVSTIPLDLHPKLKALRGTWSDIGFGAVACKSMSTSYVDTTMIPRSSMFWMRTTLVCRSGKWVLEEYAEDLRDIGGDLTAKFDRAQEIEAVITVAHDAKLTPEQLGFSFQFSTPFQPEREPSASSQPNQPEREPSASSQSPEARAEPEFVVESAEPREHREADDVPMTGDPEEFNEPAVEDRDPDMPPNAIQVENEVITSESSLELLKNACAACGIASTGNKSQLWKRLSDFVVQKEMIDQKSIAHTLEREMTRRPESQSVAAEPTQQQRDRHALTHYPFQPWCPVCVAFRSRQDRHPSVTDHSGSAVSVVSFDYGFLGLEAAGDQMTVLFVADRQTKCLHAIPAKSKAGSSLSHLVTELTRFVSWLGHNEVRLRCDNENPVRVVAEGVKKACRGCGIRVQSDTTPIDSHESNGPAEQAVQALRQQACILMKQVELGGLKTTVAADESEAKRDIDNPGSIFGIKHPLWSWAVNHSAWLHNRFHVEHGETPFERACKMSYTGKVCMFGERIMAYIRTGSMGKAAPRWTECIWLGKTTLNDVHIVWAKGAGIFVSRSIRRFEQPWDIDLASSMDVYAWEHGLANLGGVLIPKKRVQQPKPSEVPLMVDMLPPLMAHKSPSEAGTDSPVREGSDSPTSQQYSPSEPGSMSLPGVSGGSSDMSGTSVHAEPGQIPPGLPVPSGETPIPGGLRDVQDGGDGDMAVEVPPGEIRAEGLSENPRPATRRRINLITGPGDLVPIDECSAIRLVSTHDDVKSECIVNGEVFTHEDEVQSLVFDTKTAEDLENYDFDLDNSKDDVQLGNEIDPRLAVPRHDEYEPQMTEDRLRELDDIADQHELKRLEKMGVLLPSETVNNTGGPIKKLSTKMVRSWREKSTPAGEPIWLRRSRYVAREFAWLSEREDLFSPASSSIAHRILPMLVLQNPDWVLATIDISDAFLTVDQIEPTIVSYIDKDGNETVFALGKVLPGQRCGSRDWYESFTEFLKEEIAVEVCPSYPVLLRTPSRDCLMHLHVDDIMSGCERERLTRDIIPKLEKKYKVQVSILEVGGSVHFLKKKYILMSPTEMLICPHVKHFDKLFELLCIKETDYPKKIPYDPKLDEPDNSAPLDSAEATIFRSAVGILLYLSPELVESQNAIRALASCMSAPTRRAMCSLRHLGKYLLHARHHAVRLRRAREGEGLMGQYEDVIPIETMSDSDWASNKATRKSVTSSMVYMSGSLMFSASRTQKVISLSSAEAEVHSATSTMIDGLMVKTLLDFATGSSVTVNHFMDSAAGLGILKRSGVGKVRHLSCRILWTQDAVKRGVVALNKIDTKINTSDLGTKCLSRARINLLLNFCGIFDCELECLVGEEERRQFEEQSTMKQNKAILGKLSKAQIRRLIGMVLIGDALGPVYGMSTDRDRDDFNGMILHLSPNTIVQIVILWGVVMVVVMLVAAVAWCCTFGRTRRASPDDHDGEPSPKHRGAKSKFKSKPPARDNKGNDARDESVKNLRAEMDRAECSIFLRMRGASSSSNPPATEQVHVQTGPKDRSQERSGSESTMNTSAWDQLLASGTDEERHPDPLVWVAQFHGKCYHKSGCGKLDGSSAVRSMRRSRAMEKKLRECSFCRPG